MAEVNIHEAKSQLSRLLARALAGEEIIIAKAGRPVARLVPIAAPKAPRVLGADRGRFRVPEDFNASLPADLLETFEK